MDDGGLAQLEAIADAYDALADATVDVDQEWVGILSSDGVLYLVERSRVLNAGLGIATSGASTAVGNSSGNTAVAGAGPTGSGTATNQSDGSASVSTGIGRSRGSAGAAFMVVLPSQGS